MLDTKKVSGGVKFRIRVQPRASRAEITGVEEGALKLKLTAPPVKGAANEQCLKLLAKALGVNRSDLSITGGDKSRSKWIEVKGLGESSLKRLIARLTE